MKPTTKLVLSVLLVGGLVVGSVVGFVTGLKPKEGLDLQGGISVVLEAPPGTPRSVLDLALDNIRNRVDQQGVAEASVSVVGDRDIQVEVPGVTHGDITPKDGKFCATTTSGLELENPATNKICDFATRSAAQSQIQAVGQQQLLNQIGTTARLEQREVIGQATAADQVTACPPDLANDPKCNSTKYVKCPVLQVDKPGCTTADLQNKNVVFLGKGAGGFDSRPRYKMGPVLITGDAISKAFAEPPDTQHPSWWVSFNLTSAGSAKYAEVTSARVGKQLAIVLDRQVESAPTIQSAITGGSGEITGSFTETEARDLSTFLNYGALPVELQRQNVETVSPTLGKQSLHQGLIAGIVGLILLMLYLAFYYRLLGIVTWFGMSIWAVFTIALVSLMGDWIHYALSLAGIAGIIVSLGITADSYIVFYERLKDEVRHGKTLRSAVQPAFKRAWRTIYTADIVTMLAALVLYVVSIGSVRGFALTLGLSTALDMFVVYFFKRPTVFLIARSPRITELRGFGLRSGVAADPIPAVAGGSE